MAGTLKDLQDKRLKLAHEIKDLAGRQDKWTAEDSAAWDRINAEYDANQKELEGESSRVDQERQRNERLAKIENDLRHDPLAKLGRDGSRMNDGGGREFGSDPRRNPETLNLAISGWFASQCTDPRIQDLVTPEQRKAAENCGIRLNAPVLNLSLSSGKPLQEMRRHVRNTLYTQDGASGGFLFGDTFVQSLEMAMLAFGGVLRVADIIRTKTAEPMRWPTFDDTANTGAQLGEATQVSNPDGTGAQPTIGQLTWNAYKFTSDALDVSFELIRDTPFDLASIVGNLLGERLGRIQASKFATGSGAATPKGIVTAATLGVTAASATAIAFDEIIDLEHTIDPSRRNLPGVGYMFHDTILKALRKLKDGAGRYLWQAGANTGAPDTLNARPYTVCQEMASSIATTNKTILFGQLSQYKVRQVGTVRVYRLTERGRMKDVDQFVAFVESDGNLLDSGDHPVKYLQQA